MTDTLNTLLVVLNGLLVIITAFYAWATYLILRANQGVLASAEAQTEALSRPYINAILYLVSGTNIFALRIENTGHTAAQNVTLTLDRDFFAFGEKIEEKNLKNLNAFSQPIQSFGPGARIDFWLGQGVHLFDGDAKAKVTPQVFSISATYEYFGKSVTEDTTIDFRPYLMTDIPREPLVQEMKDIKKAIDELKNCLPKL
jgi:hypothetical protein